MSNSTSLDDLPNTNVLTNSLVAKIVLVTFVYKSCSFFRIF